MQDAKLTQPQVIENSFVFSLRDAPETRHIVPLELRPVVERAVQGESASKIFLSLKDEGRSVSLRQIRDVFEKLGLIAQAHETPAAGGTEFKNNWLDFAVFQMPLNPEVRVFAIKPAGILLMLLIIVLSLMGPGGLLRMYEYAGFLQWQGGYVGSLWWLIVALTLLGFGKALFQVVLQTLLTGYVPALKLSFRGLMLDVGVDSTRVEASQDKTLRLTYWMGSAYGYLAAAGVWAWFLRAEQVRDLRLLALLMTLVALNPSRRGETGKIFASLFPESSMRRLMPFMKNRSLTWMLSRQSKQEGEEKLLLYSTIGIAWMFCFLLVAQNILNANFADWWLRVQNSAPGERLTVLLLTFLLGALFILLLKDLFSVLKRNLIFPGLESRLRSERKRKTESIQSYNADKIVRQFTAIPFFQNVSEADLKRLVLQGEVRQIPDGTRLIVQGDEGHELFVLLEGEVEVLRRDIFGATEHVADLQPGALFGEIALLRQVKRTADVVARGESSVVFVLPKAVFDEFVRGSGSSASILEQRVALSTFFADCPVFRRLPQETLALFLQKGEFVEVKKGGSVIREGEADQDFYLLVRGRVKIESKGQQKAELESGGFFGEIALFERRTRTADVVALEDSLLLRLTRENFWSVVDANLNMAVDIESVAEARLGGLT